MSDFDWKTLITLKRAFAVCGKIVVVLLVIIPLYFAIYLRHLFGRGLGKLRAFLYAGITSAALALCHARTNCPSNALHNFFVLGNVQSHLTSMNGLLRFPLLPP